MASSLYITTARKIRAHHRNSVFEPAQAAFDQALATLEQASTKQTKKRRFILESINLRDVLGTVDTARKRYENEKSGSKARTCIAAFSKRICYYGNVMDVLVQHHPEYVSLAWGAMKLVFGAIVEHENLGKTIVNGLCDVADALPCVELAAYLYPTSDVKQAVSELYAHIINFLLRALKWYEEGKIAHAIHSITQPAALRYDDLLKDIGRATKRIADLAVTSNQAEQRDMHGELRALTAMVEQLKKEMLMDQSLKASSLLECRHALSEIQFTQALIFVSSACNVDHKSTLQVSLLMRDKHRLGSHRTKCPPFWLSSELYAWNASLHSASITLRAPFRNRVYIRDFCTNVIEQLHNARVAVLWVLKPLEQTYHPAIEILKSLFHQALTFDYAARADSVFTFQLRRFLDARTENDYVNLLGSCLERFKLVYIMVDAGAMNPTDAPLLKQHLQELSQRLSEHAASTILKIMALSYTPGSQPLQQKDSILLKIGKTSRRNGMKLPSQPLRSVVDGSCQQIRRGRLSPSMPLRARGRAVSAAEG